MTNKKSLVKDSWSNLRQYTSARIALGRAGGSLKTDDWLDFKLAHARARDAVHGEFDAEALAKELSSIDLPALLVSSRIKDRAEFLKRPDLGRRLDTVSKRLLSESSDTTSDLVIVVSDGLSASAVHAHVADVLSKLMPKLLEASWSLLPLVIARYGRVAIQDEIGALLAAKTALILIGERPGLSATDSLGAYLVHDPNMANTDANRNCVSNIRPAGLNYQKAADTLFYLLSEIKRRQISGVEVKDARVLMDCFIKE
ncbi:MAG TPA: ethanolamine ammonia-lyase subunit EutC [Cycloclasticus sp.]|jgi:ethanolamine ammonia-lyase small subunit|nr:ethanolamine ammonia-lyase subunit EutC [Cycloclasticus sp.]HIL92799.1 ethanolamine ammonia-lyase subunit EutC [Cycloclasticus sp.]